MSPDPGETRATEQDLDDSGHSTSSNTLSTEHHPRGVYPVGFQAFQELDRGTQAIIKKDRVVIVRQLAVPKGKRANTACLFTQGDLEAISIPIFHSQRGLI